MKENNIRTRSNYLFLFCLSFILIHNVTSPLTSFNWNVFLISNCYSKYVKMCLFSMSSVQQTQNVYYSGASQWHPKTESRVHHHYLLHLPIHIGISDVWYWSGVVDYQQFFIIFYFSAIFCFVNIIIVSIEGRLSI